MKAYSTDLRERVVRAVKEGRPREEIMHLFGVSRATIKRYAKQHRETGDLAPKSIPGRPARKGDTLRADLWGQLEANRDATLEEHCHIWEATHGQRVSAATMGRAIKSLGWTRKKKTLVASERDEEARAAWRVRVGQEQQEDWIFVDECGTHIALTSLYARSPRGTRAVSKVPRNYGANTTLIASLSATGMGEALILDGAADACAFEMYIEQVLAPSLKPGQTVVMDNLSTHRGPRVRQAIEAKRCHLLYLPSYSPDLSPIEQAFSKVKTCLRRKGARTREALQQAIAEALEAVTAQDAHGWFTHCGYLAREENAIFTEAQQFEAQAF
ncbi:Transposase [Ktedonobacter racemifer DSM 44963]|uniref:Transposase n=1 Tax=Ktedonobacter racemifer DSM 44963 TaxID=485913 RepID=D6TI91_KTERA|nr:Transposase [Ktedonobacter racemifer DSM 44963]